MHGRRSSAGFTIVVTVVMLLGAALMGVVLLFSGAPGALVVGLVLAAVPLAPLISSYMWLDRYEPEPRSLLVLGLGWGAFVATSGALLLQLFDSLIFQSDDTFTAAVVAPVTEEAAKGLFILLLLFYRRHELDGVLDGLVYAGMVGIGFAFTENILYLMAAYMGEDGQTGGIGGAVGLFIVRCVFCPFAHPFFTAFIGIGIGVAVGARSKAVRVIAPIIGATTRTVLLREVTASPIPIPMKAVKKGWANGLNTPLTMKSPTAPPSPPAWPSSPMYAEAR